MQHLSFCGKCLRRGNSISDLWIQAGSTFQLRVLGDGGARRELCGKREAGAHGRGGRCNCTRDAIDGGGTFRRSTPFW